MYAGFKFHGLHLANRVEFEFAIQTENYHLDRSGWNIVHDFDPKKGTKIRPGLLLIAEKQIHLNETLSLISLVGILKSLYYLCKEDVLSLGILAQFIILLPVTRGVSGR